MIDRKERKPYWRHTKLQLIASLLPFMVVVLALPLYAERLSTARVIGFPWAYFLLLHGITVIALVTVASFVNRQDAIDRWHGAHEGT